MSSCVCVFGRITYLGKIYVNTSKFHHRPSMAAISNVLAFFVLACLASARVLDSKCLPPIRRRFFVFVFVFACKAAGAAGAVVAGATTSRRLVSRRCVLRGLGCCCAAARRRSGGDAGIGFTKDRMLPNPLSARFFSWAASDLGENIASNFERASGDMNDVILPMAVLHNPK